MENNLEIFGGIGVIIAIFIVVNLLVIYLFKDRRVSFLTSLSSMILIISNIISVKEINFIGLSLPVSVFIYPLIFACVLAICKLKGAKDAVKSIVCIVLTQLVFTMFICITGLIFNPNANGTIGHNNLISIFGSTPMDTFKVALSSIVTFFVSGTITVLLFEYIKKHVYDILGLLLALIIGLSIDAALFTILTINTKVDLINVVMSKLVIHTAYSFVLAFLYYVLIVNNKVKKSKTKK